MNKAFVPLIGSAHLRDLNRADTFTEQLLCRTRSYALHCFV